VKSKQAKGAATQIVKAVKGVKSVENKITIEKPVKKADKPVEK
jgi:osmotically-inducible protein OsmY